MKRIICAVALAFISVSSADAKPKKKVIIAHPDCGVTMPCQDVAPSTRGLQMERRLPLGRAQKVYEATIVAHPTGCPKVAFCGCGASVELFGKPVRELFLARNWFKFPRSSPGHNMVAVRRNHVFVLKEHRGGSNWLVYDANSGRRQTRVHIRSIAGYTIVNPNGALASL